MLKVIHVIDGFDRGAVASAVADADAATWTVPDDGGPIVEWAAIATAAAPEALRVALGDAADPSSVPSRLVRLAADAVGRPWGDGDGWIALHILSGAEGPGAGGLSVFRPAPAEDAEWEPTLHLPVEVDRLFIFRRSMACAWSDAETEDGASLLARAFLIAESAA